MSTNKSRREVESSKRSSHRSQAVLATTAILFATWILTNYNRGIHPLGYVTTVAAWIIANLSMFRVTIIVGLGGSLLSIPIMRRKRYSEPIPMKPAKTHYSNQPMGVHPLLWTLRPSRDPKFIIRKTKKRGHISRNRGGQRLPTDPLDKDEIDLD